MPTYSDVNRMIGSKINIYIGRRKMVLRSLSNFDTGADISLPDILLNSAA